jgi:hypothetical protein
MFNTKMNSRVTYIWCGTWSNQFQARETVNIHVLLFPRFMLNFSILCNSQAGPWVCSWLEHICQPLQVFCWHFSFCLSQKSKGLLCTGRVPMYRGMTTLAGECRAWQQVRKLVRSASWHQEGLWTLTLVPRHAQCMWEEPVVCGQPLSNHDALSHFLSFGPGQNLIRETRHFQLVDEK